MLFEPAGRTTASGSPRRRMRSYEGSVLLMVVVMLVLLVVMGVAYIQVARVQRQGVREFRGDIDAAEAATIEHIKQILKLDLNEFQRGIYRAEPYDYPWTNPEIFDGSELTGWSEPPKKLLETGGLGSDGGKYDDVWLASTWPEELDFGGTQRLAWRHLSNLMGIWLDLPDPEGNKLLPRERMTTGDLYGHVDKRDSHMRPIGGFDLSARFSSDYEIRGADASGNGILDSRWTWCPLPLVDGVAYVMAVRVIDLNSLADINVALSQVDTSRNFSGGDEPRWTSPSELDLGGVVYDMVHKAPVAPPYSATAMTQLDNLITYRFNGIAGVYLPTSWGFSSRQRGHFWFNGPALYDNFDSNFYRSLSIFDEQELRRLGGLNDANVVADIEDPDKGGMEALLRQDLVSESSYVDALVNMNLNSGTLTEKIQRYYRFNPRTNFTTLSGVGVFATSLPEEPLSAPLKKDINYLISIGDSETPAYDSLQKEIQDVLAPAGGTDLVVPSDGWGLVGTPLVEEYARRFAVCISDYADADNQLSMSSDGTTEFYGSEALPYVTEVYAQRAYEITDATDNDPMPGSPGTPGEGSWTVTWTQQGEVGYAIEIGNPFNKSIRLDRVHLYIDGSSVGTLDTLTDGVSFLDAGARLVLYKDSTGGSPDEDNVDGRLFPALPPDVDKEDISHDWPTNEQMTFDDIDIELRAEDQSGTTLDWAYSRVVSHEFPKTVEQDLFIHPSLDQGGTDPSTMMIQDYAQRSRVGNGNGLNMMLVDHAEVVEHDTGPDDNGIYVDTEHNLTETNKTHGYSDELAATSQEQLIIADRITGIEHVAEILNVAIIGPTVEVATNTVTTTAEHWDTTSSVAQLLLDVSDTSPVVKTTSPSDPDNGIYDVTHGEFLVERFVTLSPRTDNEDNDGDGVTDNEEEVFLPGMININTMPLELMASYLPIPNDVLRGEVAKRIGKRRHLLENRGGVAGSDPRPAIAYISELFRDYDSGVLNPTENLSLRTLLTGGDPGWPGGLPGDTPDISGVQVDFLANSGAGVDGVGDDREEELILIKYLREVATTRSDRFAAYVLLRGYQADDFRNGGEGAIHSRRFVALFDRSSVVDADDGVKLLGVLRID